MNKDDLLRRVAETGYNVGFGAKKHFASYDLIKKSPFFTTYIPIFVGIFALTSDCLSKKQISAALLIIGIIGIYFNQYTEKEENYRSVGVQLTLLFNRTKELYFKIKAHQDNDLAIFQSEIQTIESELNSCAISDQLILSDLYAHYKFFGQHEISWIEESRPFSFVRDKIPSNLYAFTILIIIWFFGCKIFLCR